MPVSNYHCRVAALSERRVKQDQSKVEDTLSENRQSMVEEDFANFFDGMRMDTCEKIQTSCSFKEPIEVDIYCPRLLCLVFEVCLAITDKLTLMKCRCLVYGINSSFWSRLKNFEPTFLIRRWASATYKKTYLNIIFSSRQAVVHCL